MTDPRLLAREQLGSRTPENFFSTRLAGLMRAPAGEATVLIPPQQIKRFAGARRLYYVLGCYRDPNGRDAVFSAAPEAVEGLPYIRISPDFTGRGLQDARASDRWGARGAPLVWGGDLRGHAPKAGYDDGHDPSLWREGPREADPPAPAPMAAPPPPGSLDVDDLPEAGAHDPDGYGRRSRALAEPEGAEDGRSLDRAPVWGRRTAALPEPEGFEDATAALQAGYGSGRQQGTREVVDQPEPPGLEEPPRETHYGAGPQHPEPAHGRDRVDPDGYGARAERARGVPLDTREKMRVLASVLRARGGSAAYGACAAETGRGLRWGIAGFAQDDGGLAEALGAAFGREGSNGYRPTEIADQAIGAEAAQQLRAWAEAAQRSPDRRADPVGGRPLSDRTWVQRLERLGGLHRATPEGIGLASTSDPFKAAQNEVAIRRVVDPLLPAARRLGARTDRSLALLVDHALDHGVPAAESWWEAEIGPDEPGRRLGAHCAPRVHALLQDREQLHDTVYELGPE